MDDLWDIVFAQETRQEGFRGLGITMTLEEDVEHESVLFDCLPEPVSDAIHSRTHLVKVAQFFREEGSEVYAPFAESFVADLSAALIEQCLHVSVTQGKAVVEPNRVLDNAHRESVAVRLDAHHGGSAYPDPVEATQPTEPLDRITAYVRCCPHLICGSTACIFSEPLDEPHSSPALDMKV